ncbi:NADPH:quinone reductase-like Zn-dependent oxidoreductase [Azospirillum lipoferum]|uniref:Zinc-dependent alcohol dehydrogenase family protein n=1 Tax=Azospirillum lipoferum TaxID=193 RepID=A0A5A9GM44_AZOLI|nr:MULTISPECIES: zinc-dependent alcohol dehydrogenase family protein [Azospirillum]KAA0595407.1 zinc-dependent alcohol dehydrogenase family protein [Azospirillum lipoferum]MCP1611691.1 NADPH:quinone reductase-like Zn-dependent oxidoreductase [Azospirillum lipoferum]MDW5533550.1 zinc-dependent alcohol dehydrogenase family protein [Azospirillum sp. NL1]
MTGRVVRFHETGGPEVLRIERLDTPAPGPGEVTVRIAAIGLNRAEAAFRAGRYLEVPRPPARIGCEACGIVEEIGDGVCSVAPGDAVCVLPAFPMNDFGVYADRAVVPAAALIPWPPGLSASYAAALWMAYLTAWGALVDVAAIAPGDIVVITAASSSVGLAAIQTANLIGALPVAVTRDPDKAEALRAAGAALVVVSGEQDVATELRRHFGGRGARLVFDPIAGPGVQALAEALDAGGQMILYGNLSEAAERTPFPFFPAVRLGLALRGYLVFDLIRDPVRLERARSGILFGLNAGSLRPTIARTFDLDDIVEAHRYLESNQQVGKLVVSVTG